MKPTGFKTLGDRGYTIADEILTAIEDGHTLEQIELKINLYLLALGQGIDTINIKIERG